MNIEIDSIAERMMEFDAGSPVRIQHFIKVHRFAQLIARGENLDEHIQAVLECAALVHDIGIGPCLEKYGSSNGALQEKEGPAYAVALLSEFDIPKEDIERICFLVAHHHTYNMIDSIDYQILVEADFLVNFYEEEFKKDAIETTFNRIFKTNTGRDICKTMFGLE